MEIGQSSSPAPWKKYSWDPKIQTSGETPPAPPPHVSKAHPLSWHPPPFLEPTKLHFYQQATGLFPPSRDNSFQPVAGRHTPSCPGHRQHAQPPAQPGPAGPSESPASYAQSVAHSRGTLAHPPPLTHTHTSSLAALEMRGAKSPHPLSSVGHEKSGWEEVATREKEQIGAKAKSEGRTNSNWVVLRLLRLSSPPSQRVRFQHKSARGIAAPCNQ